MFFEDGNGVYSIHRPNNPSNYRLPVFNPDAKRNVIAFNGITFYTINTAALLNAAAVHSRRT